jgi:hypothetical protein
MTVNGLSPSTVNGDRGASADGIDDVALSSGPETTPGESPEFGVAMVFRSTDTADGLRWFGVEDGNSNFTIRQSDFFQPTLGQLLFLLNDANGDTLAAETQGVFVDGDAHAVIINKVANSGSQAIRFYIDGQLVPSSVVIDSGFDDSAYSVGLDMGFSALNAPNGIFGHMDIELPFIEFNSDPYSQQDRLDLLRRAPGL